MIRVILTWRRECWAWNNNTVICGKWSEKLEFDTDYPMLVTISPVYQEGFHEFTSFFQDWKDQQEFHLDEYVIEDHYAYIIQELAKEAGCEGIGEDEHTEFEISGWVKFETINESGEPGTIHPNLVEESTLCLE